jgi:hypothetical protein
MEFSKVQAIVQAAFKPHRCVAENWDYSYLRFQVTTDDGKRWSAGDTRKAPTEKIPYEDTKSVQEVVGILRKRLTAKGYRLDEWSWPED